MAPGSCSATLYGGLPCGHLPFRRINARPKTRSARRCVPPGGGAANETLTAAPFLGLEFVAANWHPGRMDTLPGPIARKVIFQVRGLEAQKVVDLHAWGDAKKQAERIYDESRPSKDTLDEVGPEFAIYTYVNNWAVSMLELLQELPELRKYMRKFIEAEEEYMPSGPPMSPLTRSFFYHWALYDLTIGVKRETMGSILLEIGRALKMPPDFLATLEKLVSGRLGLYLHEGVQGEDILLKELLTDERHRAICASGHSGSPGELWLARVLLPPAPGARAVVMTTPYLILKPSVPDWLEYLQRTLPATQREDPRKAFEYLMKFGLQPNYWPEYVFEAYVNHLPEVIFLRGLPDVPESRPHSRVNS